MKWTSGTCEDTKNRFLCAYRNRKLLEYAESFRDLAKTFTYIKENGEKAEEDRQTCLFKRRLVENREILASHLNEIAGMITEVAEESYQIHLLKEKEWKKLNHACKGKGIFIREVCLMTDDKDNVKLSVTVKAGEDNVVTMEEIADFLSEVFEKRYVPEKNSLFFLPKEYETVVFEEKARFYVLTAAAKATRESETVSGDTYSFIEKGNSNMIMALSDGMGSGEKAMEDSETVIDMLEKFMDAGFSKEVAVEMINGTLVARSEEENMSTLDICDIDLYNGLCELMKIGSSYTYIKRGHYVEQITSDTLPLGIFHKTDTEICERQLIEGDYVVIVSDGVVEGMGDGEVIKDIISRLETRNCQEIANTILKLTLHHTMGRIADDMTVLVAGIWENP